MTRLYEMENVGLVVFGRVADTEFESVDAIEKAGEDVAELAKKHRVRAELIYCGTTINWPDDFEFTPVAIGIVKYESYSSDDDYGEGAEEPEVVPPAVFSADRIPQDFWTELAERGITANGEDRTMLAIGGWTWTELRQGDEVIASTSGEDDGCIDIAIDPSAGPIQIRSGYC